MPSSARSPRRRFAAALVFLGSLFIAAPAALHAQDEPVAITGTIEGENYVSASGRYRMRIPVHAELGGTITDSANSVTFQDAFKVHVSVAEFPLDATLRWEESTRGRKEFLGWFFTRSIAAELGNRYPGTKVENNARFIGSVQGGALLTFLYIPGGSAFAELGGVDADVASAIVAMRGNLVFIQDEHLYVISTELVERSLAPLTWDKTPEQDAELLRARLLELAGRMTFTAPSGAAPAPVPPAAGTPAAPSPSSAEEPMIRLPASLTPPPKP